MRTVRTHYEVELCISLEGIVQGDKEGEVPDGFHHAPLCQCVLHNLPLADNGGLLEHLHSIQLAAVPPTYFTNQEHLPIAWELSD